MISTSSSSASSIARRASVGSDRIARFNRLARARARRSRIKVTGFIDFAPSPRPRIAVCTFSHTVQAHGHAISRGLTQQLARVLTGRAVPLPGAEHAHELADDLVAAERRHRCSRRQYGGVLGDREVPGRGGRHLWEMGYAEDLPAACELLKV